MTDQKESLYTGERIDLRGLILTVWRAKWIILGTTLIVGLIAFLISPYLFPERYKATAIVTVTDPDLNAKLVVRGLPQIAKSNELINLTLTELGITDLESQRSLKFVAIMQDRGQLMLEARADNPAGAAEAANTWAEVVHEHISEVIGTSEEILRVLEEEVSLAEDGLSDAQAALEEYLTGSPLETFPVRLQAAQSTLSKTLLEIERNQLMVSDAQTLEAQIEGLDPADFLNMGIARSVIYLEGQVVAVEEEPYRQSQEDNSLKSDLTLSEAVTILKQFRIALEDQNELLEEEAAALETEIPELASSLEKERYQVEQLTLKRDLAKKTYTELAQQLDDFRLIHNQAKVSVQISIRALPPSDPFSPNLIAIAGSAGVSAAMLTMLGILFFTWWVERDEN